MIDIARSTENVIHYKLRPDSYRADIILLLDKNNAFRLVIVSEFGNWDSYWSAPGDSINDFLCSLNLSYLQDRLLEPKPTKVEKSKFNRFWDIIWSVFVAQLKKEAVPAEE